MIQRVVLLAGLSACRLIAQFSIVLVQDGQEVTSDNGHYGFGRGVPIGTAVDLHFRLKNAGSDAAVVISLSDPSFSLLSAFPTAIPAGTAADLTVEFKPTQPIFSSSTVTVNASILATFEGAGIVRPAASVALDDGTPLPSPLDFGNVTRGATASRRIVLSNPATADLLVYVETRGAPFQLQPDASPITIPGGGSKTIEIDFSPAADGPTPNALLVNQQIFPLMGTGIEPPFPQPTINIELAKIASAEQGTLQVALAAPSQATGAGEVQINFRPAIASANPDTGILFMSTGSLAVPFTVKQGDVAVRFGSADNAAFQTGTTAGDLTFTLTFDMPNNPSTEKTITVPSALVTIDSTQAQRTSAGLDLKLSGFDNTRSASKMTFTFFDQNASALNPGAITVESAATFQQFFGSSDLGGVFGLHAFFPVNGNPAQVDSVQIEIVNAAGSLQSGKVRFTSTP
jgi:hypothetical protein